MEHSAPFLPINEKMLSWVVLSPYSWQVSLEAKVSYLIQIIPYRMIGEETNLWLQVPFHPEEHVTNMFLCAKWNGEPLTKHTRSREHCVLRLCGPDRIQETLISLCFSTSLRHEADHLPPRSLASLIFLQNIFS